MTEIRSSAFCECTKLTSIIIPNSVTILGGKAFENCSHLRTASISDGIVTVEFDLFNGCSELTTVSLGSGVESISGDAFKNCESLIEVTSMAITPPIAESDYFLGGILQVLKVPQTSVEAYKVSPGWNKYSEIIVGI